MITNARSFYVNSTNRVNGVNGNFSYIIKIPQNERFNRVVILDCLIPKSYYLISSDRNEFTLDVPMQDLVGDLRMISSFGSLLDVA